MRAKKSSIKNSIIRMSNARSLRRSNKRSNARSLRRSNKRSNTRSLRRSSARSNTKSLRRSNARRKNLTSPKGRKSVKKSRKIYNNLLTRSPLSPSSTTKGSTKSKSTNARKTKYVRAGGAGETSADAGGGNKTSRLSLQ